ncbi:hypothetical protein [Xenorhabdus sp. SGI246]|uniref:hypothetical protein n=1 Tax=Xenorhabdus sp. SGI246 TaxID=3158263 RepID=UPI00349F0D09
MKRLTPLLALNAALAQISLPFRAPLAFLAPSFAPASTACRPVLVSNFPTPLSSPRVGGTRNSTATSNARCQPENSSSISR